MEKLKFYTTDLAYVDYLQKAEKLARGFSRVPNLDYGENRRENFLCGVVLNVNNIFYYAPISSYKTKQSNNFLIRDEHGTVVSSLRFNYMFPVPKELTTVRNISSEPDYTYRRLLQQEIKFCRNNQTSIEKLADQTYNHVILGKNKGLVANSCDFVLLEQKCIKYSIDHNLSVAPQQRYKVEFEGNCQYRQYRQEQMALVKEIENNCKCFVVFSDGSFKVAIHNDSITRADELHLHHQHKGTQGLKL